MAQDQYHRFQLVTRSDFDGMVCAVLLDALGLLDGIRFAHPKDVQDGIVRIGPRDITANLPYQPAAHLAFDHHSSERLRISGEHDNLVLKGDAPSAARVIYDHYGGKAAFPGIPEALLTAVDKADSAQFTLDEVMAPSGWVLLSFLTDPRTGLGRVSEFRISDSELLLDLIPRCKDHSIDELLAHPDVRERSEVYFRHDAMAREQIRRCTRVYKHLGVLDLRNEEPIWACNRFMIYALYPHINISIHVLWGRYRARTVFAAGHSIFNRSSRINIGELMLSYGGGGHRAAGTCQVENDRAESVLDELFQRIAADG